jgi:dephospho-CoA kinase
MKIIGLTGGIGSGKSYISSLFLQMGIPVYNSDCRARELTDTNPEITQALSNRYGFDIYINGKLNRPLVARRVFSDKEELKWLNHIVHPIVKVDFEDWKKRQYSPYIIREAAILIESGTYTDCSSIIVVQAPVNLRIERVIKRDNLTKEQVLQRMANQLSDEEREKYATYLIYNDGIQLVEPQIKIIHNKIINSDENR